MIMINYLIILFLITEKIEMPPIRKKHSVNGKTKHPADKHRWHAMHTSLHHKLPFTGYQFVKKNIEINNKMRSFIPLKLHGAFGSSENLSLSVNKQNDHQRKHHNVIPNPVKNKIVHKRPNLKHLSRIRSFLNSKFSRLARNSLAIPVKTVKRNVVKAFIKPMSSNFSGSKKTHYLDIEPRNSLSIRSKFLRSNSGEDHAEEDIQDDSQKQSKQFFQPISSPVSAPIQAVLLPQNIPGNASKNQQQWFQLPPPGQEHWVMFSTTSDNNAFKAESSSETEEEYEQDDSTKQPKQSFQAMSSPISAPIHAVLLPQRNSSDVSKNQQWFQLPPPGQEHWVMTTTESQQNAFKTESSSETEDEYELDDSTKQENQPFRNMNAPISVPFPIQDKKVAIPPYSNSPPRPVSELKINQYPVYGTNAGNFSTLMQGKIADDWKKYPKNISESYKGRIQDGQNNATFKSTGRSELSSSLPSTALNFFRDNLGKIKKLSRIKENKIFLAMLMIFLLIISASVLLLVKCCKYQSDELRTYPKIKTDLTFLGNSKQMQGDLLRRIGSIKKYDHLNS